MKRDGRERRQHFKLHIFESWIGAGEGGGQASTSGNTEVVAGEGDEVDERDERDGMDRLEKIHLSAI
jgi:hypothetical protein